MLLPDRIARETPNNSDKVAILTPWFDKNGAAIALGNNISTRLYEITAITVAIHEYFA